MGQLKEFFEYIFNAIKIWIIVQPWQTGIRVRCGKRTKLLKNGIYFRIPYFDSVYIQESRLRVTEMSIQTLTSKDLKTITLNSSFGYSIVNINTLYNTLYQPEKTLQNIAMSEIADYIWTHSLNEITPELIESSVMSKLSANDYGLKFEYFRITNFAVVRTYRLIQDQSWISEGLKMDDKH